LLPASFGDRFIFDAQLIAALADEYSQGQVQLSAMLVPKPSHSWGHQTVPMPSQAGQRAHLIDVIHVPGDDSSDDIDLLAYPFLCHELGHNVLFRYGEAFTKSFETALTKFLNRMQQQNLAIRGQARQVADATVANIRQYWNPTHDHFNWAHETAVDVFALWTCGPAYLAALQDIMEDPNLDPYQLGQSHPPYALRAQLLVQAAGELGWAYYTGPLQQLLDAWPQSKWRDHQTNLHVACANPDLTDGIISSARQTYANLALPQCTPSQITAMQQKLGDGLRPKLGIETIISAWLKRAELPEADYDQWERNLVRDYLRDITE
jgi:hypothetical protein